jgi:hypothetical protein
MTDKPLTELSDLLAEEVGLVDRGANKKKRFPVFKREKEQIMQDYEEVLKAVLEMELDEEAQLAEALEKAEVSPKAQAAARIALRALSGFKDEYPKDILDKLGNIAGYPAPKAKAKAEEKPKEEEDYPMPKEKAQAKKAEGEEQEATEVEKQLADIRKAHEEQISALTKQNEEIRKSLDTEREERRRQTLIAKAKDELSYCPGQSAEEQADLILKLEKVDKELADQQWAQMKATSEAMQKSEMFREAGASFGSGSEGSAYAKLEKMAAGLVEKSTGDLTSEQAFARVIKTAEGAKLYSQYLDEHPDQN